MSTLVCLSKWSGLASREEQDIVAVMRTRTVAAIFLSLLLLLCAAASLVTFLFIPFLFDAPGTEDQPAVWAMAGAILSFPLMCLVAIAGLWIAAFPAGRSLWWYASLALPFLSLLAFLVATSYRPGFF